MVESPEPDPARPTPAGIYDYLSGGQHYSAADQAAAEQAVAMTPFVSQVSRNWDRAASGVVMRSRDQVSCLLAGFDLVPPGLVTTVEWGTDRPPATGAGSILAAVGTVSD